MPKLRFTPALILTTAISLLAGCASHRLGPQAVFVSEQDKQDPPLEISAAFRQDLCSPNVAYVAVSIRNPSDEWQELHNLELTSPYATYYDENQFDVLTGHELLAWADALELQSRRNEHNAALARTAVRSVSRLMMASDERGVQVAGLAIAVGEAANRATNRVRQSMREASMPIGASSNHLYSDILTIPPRMDRVFWITLKARPDAPLMSWLSAAYLDQSGQSHQFVAPLDNWAECGWQEKRRIALRDWGRDNDRIPYRLNTDGSKELLRYDTTQLERQYQQARETLSSN